MENRWQKVVVTFLSVLGGLFLALILWWGYSDYQDFRNMRRWVATMQQRQQEAAQRQARPPVAPTAPAVVPPQPEK